MSAHHQVVASIGLLSRALSELKVLALSPLDEADRQTVKHHAEDCIGLGHRVLQIVSGADRETCQEFVVGQLLTEGKVRVRVVAAFYSLNGERAYVVETDRGDQTIERGTNPNLRAA